MSDRIPNIAITNKMKKEYTLLFPDMIDIHFHLLQNILRSCGYNVELLTNHSENILEEGQKYVHNDTCYPALITIGQMIAALQSGKYDLNHTILVLSQTGGGCRASNYIFLLKKALINAGFSKVPVLSFNLSNLLDKNGLDLGVITLYKMLASMEYGDLLMLLSHHIRPYEKNKGETNKKINKWISYISEQFQKDSGYSIKSVRKINKDIVNDFNTIKTVNKKLTKVGIVGEIFVKFSSYANNNLVGFLESQNCEVMVPGIFNFILYALDMPIEDLRLYGGNPIKKHTGDYLLKYIKKYEEILHESINEIYHLQSYDHLKYEVEDYIHTGCKMGEGWLLVAEILELINLEFDNIICVQPFGCLPNHIVGKGMMKKIRMNHPKSNIVTIDYDPGTSKVNQENRIRLMLAIANEKKDD